MQNSLELCILLCFRCDECSLIAHKGGVQSDGSTHDAASLPKPIFPSDLNL